MKRFACVISCYVVGWISDIVFGCYEYLQSITSRNTCSINIIVYTC